MVEGGKCGGEVFRCLFGRSKQPPAMDKEHSNRDAFYFLYLIAINLVIICAPYFFWVIYSLVHLYQWLASVQLHVLLRLLRGTLKRPRGRHRKEDIESQYLDHNNIN